MAIIDVALLEKVLQTYTLEEILEFNEVAQEDILLFLIEEYNLKLPEVLPL